MVRWAALIPEGAQFESPIHQSGQYQIAGPFQSMGYI